ncbi:MAG: TonB family protein [Candidatus Auribacterota bacterium]|nr:TonB family protein [Candidatus Auribacterota bacterium]
MAAFFKNRLLVFSFLISVSIHLIVLGASPALRMLASKKKKDKYIEILFYSTKLPEIQPRRIKRPKITSSVQVKSKAKNKDQIKKAQAKKVIKPQPKKEIEKEESKRTLEKAKKEFAPQAKLVKIYVARLNELVKQYVRLNYPQSAKRRGLEGKVTVVFTLNKHGKLTFITVPKASRSKHEEFNTAAVIAVKEASKRFKEPFPEGIDQFEIMFSLEVVFELYK